jgi:hypothetical protein
VAGGWDWRHEALPCSSPTGNRQGKQRWPVGVAIHRHRPLTAAFFALPVASHASTFFCFYNHRSLPFFFYHPRTVKQTLLDQHSTQLDVAILACMGELPCVRAWSSNHGLHIALDYRSNHIPRPLHTGPANCILCSLSYDDPINHFLILPGLRISCLPSRWRHLAHHRRSTWYNTKYKHILTRKIETTLDI